MATYSHSRVSTFENCPRKYKLQYIEKEEPEISTTIEAFMGDIVHQALQDLYKRKKFKQRVSKESLIKFYRETWEKEYSDDILVVKADKGLTADNYKKIGEGFLSDYYDKYKPFEQLTILGLETQDRMTLPDGSQWHVRIDKFACDDKGNYYVMDYKTNARMKDQEEADSDRQLAMYSFWVRDKFKDAKSVKLVWHMLAFNKEVTSERTPQQLKALQDEVLQLIKNIEKATKEDKFPTNVTSLCDYCGFKHLCPSFKHQVELNIKEEESIKKFKQDEGLQLVDELSKIKQQLQELTEKEVSISNNIIAYAKQFGADIIYGSNNIAKVKEVEKIILPQDQKQKDAFIKLLKEKGLYEQCSMICYPIIKSKFIKEDLPKEILSKIDVEKEWNLRLSKRKYGDKEE